MNEQTATSLFHGKEGFNCVQAIFKAFQPLSKMTDEEIARYAGSGRGKTVEGYCGALFAVLHFPHVTVERKQQARSAFEREAGSTLCREISRLRKISCKQCVALGARILTENFYEPKMHNEV